MSKFLQFTKALPEVGFLYVRPEGVNAVMVDDANHGAVTLVVNGTWQRVAEPLDAVLAAVSDALDGADALAERALPENDPPGVAPIGSFSWALERLKAGGRVARRGWNGKGMWLVLVPKEHWGLGSAVPFDWGDVRNHLKPWIGMKTADNGFVPWLASQTDLLADDWEIVLDWNEVSKDGQ